MSRRIEDEALITGRGRYVADLIPDDALHCAFVPSYAAHGRITGIDIDDAVSSPGVVAVFVAEDLNLRDIPGNTGRGPAAEPMVRPPLARGVVRYVGEPVAVVVAETAQAAEDAAGLVWVDIDELTPVTTPAESLAGDVVLFAGTSDNVVDRTSIEHGPEPAAAFEVSVTVDVVHQRLAPSPIETNTILAAPDGDILRVWCGHQAPHRLRNQIAMVLDLDPSLVRATVPDVGGAFGMKGMFFPEYPVVAALAKRLGRPVAWIQPRHESFTGGTHGRAQVHTVTIEGSADGRIGRARFEVVAETGAYPHNGSNIPMFGRLVATGFYDIPRVEYTTTVLVTNLAPTGSYRGAGRPEAALTIERGIDAFARAAGLDPLAVRLTNAIPPEQVPYQTATGALYDSGDYPAALQKVASMLDFPALREEQQRRLAEGGPLLGIGLGAFVERAGGAAASGEYGRVEVDRDNHQIVVRTGSTDSGQGHRTVWSEVVAKIFGVKDVRVVAGDTAEVAQGIGTFASRSAQIGASAAFRLSQRILEEAKQRAATRLEVDPVDLRYEAGVFSVAGSPGSEVTLWDLADEELADEEMYSPGAQTFPYGVHAAVVEVQPETGEVRVREIVAVDDCGKVLNPMIVDGQLHGSLAQGLGQAMYEEVRYDEAGQPLMTSFVSYLIPTAADVPPIRAARIEHPAPSNPLGVKGAGEAGCIGLPPAILNATLDALAPLGVTDLQLPLRPEKVWRAIRDAAQST